MLIFVIQDHHARSHHYDFRLEHKGVLKSWAVPKGVPTQTGQKNLAIETEDHPMEHAEVEGVMGKGRYGAGSVEIWDKGTYESEKWTDKAIVVNLGGSRVQGRYCLIRFPKAGPRHWLLYRLS